MSQAQQIDSVLERLENVLVTERQLLLSGRAHEAADLVEEKMQALESFDSVLADANGADARQGKRVAAIVGLARENANHFSAVRNGLTAAISRIGSFAEDAYVGAYGQAGQKTAFSKATGNYLKKA